MKEGMRKSRGFFPIILAAALCALLLMQVAPAAPAADPPHAAQAGWWLLAEGSTAGGMQTWILVLNPDPTNTVTASLTLMTDSGPQTPPELQDVPILPQHRMTFYLNAFVTSYDVSTQVTTAGYADIVCERAMYGPGLTWAHDSIGMASSQTVWWMAEGCTAGGFETWILVQNIDYVDTTVNFTLMTDSGPQNPPALQGYLVPGQSRRSVRLNDYVTTYDVSTYVQTPSGSIVCERATYGPGREFATESIAADSPANTWYLAEGSTAGGMETWVLVQNPYSYDIPVNITLNTDSGPVNPPALQNYPIPAQSRVSFNLGDYLQTYNVATEVATVNPVDGVVCERAMYGPGRVWAHSSIGATSSGSPWFLAEGSTSGDMETWLLVQAPTGFDAEINITLLTEGGTAAPPDLQGVTIPAHGRVSFNLGAYLDEYNFGIKVQAWYGPVVCERAMYGNGRQWATDSIGFRL